MPAESLVHVIANDLWQSFWIKGVVVWADLAIPDLLSLLVLHGDGISGIPLFCTGIANVRPQHFTISVLRNISQELVVADFATPFLLILAF